MSRPRIPKVRVEDRPEGKVFVLCNEKGEPDPTIPIKSALFLCVRLNQALNEAMGGPKS